MRIELLTKNKLIDENNFFAITYFVEVWPNARQDDGEAKTYEEHREVNDS